jgi:hypothetical protein
MPASYPLVTCHSLFHYSLPANGMFNPWCPIIPHFVYHRKDTPAVTLSATCQQAIPEVSCRQFFLPFPHRFHGSEIVPYLVVVLGADGAMVSRVRNSSSSSISWPARASNSSGTGLYSSSLSCSSGDSLRAMRSSFLAPSVEVMAAFWDLHLLPVNAVKEGADIIGGKPLEVTWR